MPMASWPMTPLADHPYQSPRAMCRSEWHTPDGADAHQRLLVARFRDGDVLDLQGAVLEPCCLHVDSSVGCGSGADHATGPTTTCQLPIGPTAAISYWRISADRTGTASGSSGRGRAHAGEVRRQVLLALPPLEQIDPAGLERIGTQDVVDAPRLGA